jgi:hypothetical protein
MVGSQTLDPGADMITPFIDFRITHSYQQRMKKGIDVLLSLFFIITIPFHFVLHPTPGNFIRNIFHVLTGTKTWVGYATIAASLPAIQQSVISSLGNAINVAPSLLAKADKLYAKNYDWWQDIVIVFKNYRQLGNR